MLVCNVVLLSPCRRRCHQAPPQFPLLNLPLDEGVLPVGGSNGPWDPLRLGEGQVNRRNHFFFEKHDHLKLVETPMEMPRINN